MPDLRAATPALDRFTRDLTADARTGRLEAVRCRDEEIARALDILLRQGKNNPALVGPAGVGKTAIAEGLAMRLASGAVPVTLRGLRLLSLDAVGLLAGTTYRGQYEERLRALVAETSGAEDVLLFVDEMHNLIGQGSATGSAMDAANMLKPALARGEFRLMGATTDEEYDRWILGDPALDRRFQKIVVRELSPAETLEIIRTRVPSLVQHHNVLIADTAVRAAIELTDLWVPERRRPDKAIDALDEACAHSQATAAYSAETESLIARRRGWDRAARRAGAAGGSVPSGPPPLDAMARNGIAALERLGAELESAFAGQRAKGHVSTSGPGDASAVPAEPASGAERAALDVALERRLLDEGIVVRGHDVARVVGLMTGRRIEWEE
jgi:ATP-dependent Clp protease ATP-binding subunit ClpC